MSEDNKTFFISGSDFEILLDVLEKNGKVYVPGEVINRVGITNYPYVERNGNETYKFRGYHIKRLVNWMNGLGGFRYHEHINKTV